MDKTDLLAFTVRENACRAVEYHNDTFSGSDLIRILRIIAGQKAYNELYDVCPIEVNGTLYSSADGLTLSPADTLICHPDGVITQSDYAVMQRLILAGIKPSDLTVAAG